MPRFCSQNRPSRIDSRECEVTAFSGSPLLASVSVHATAQHSLFRPVTAPTPRLTSGIFAQTPALVRGVNLINSRDSNSCQVDTTGRVKPRKREVMRWRFRQWTYCGANCFVIAEHIASLTARPFNRGTMLYFFRWLVRDFSMPGRGRRIRGHELRPTGVSCNPCCVQAGSIASTWRCHW